ncbi:MAG: cobyric acid synthase [Syntrophomonadaceae bacterium]|nr:cobyric acid synthase [Syntrophomonadaceae bacterium]
MARAIMVQGTSSNVGKSILCTALCRIFAQDGFRTVPFKAQNMALNSTVTPDGGEIGRAQGAQAEAAGVKPTVYMNPILLKPKQDMEAQVIILGTPIGDMSAREYRNDYLPKAEALVLECINRLKEEFEVLVIEGAGSPAEVNLKDRDIVNMKTAELADAPVLLVADIDRGGVFASLIGTLDLLDPHERNRVKAFIINKFRGDIQLLKPGLDFLEEKTGIPILGVIPYIHEHGIDEEDSVCLAEIKDSGALDAPIQIAVIQLPRISNFTDINPFLTLPDTRVYFVKKGDRIGDADVVIIPGTKNSILDLYYLKEEGYDEEILTLASRGKYVVGICGGYQMLGQELLDPQGTEAGIGSQQGLGLLSGVTTYGSQKNTHQVTATILARIGFWRELYGQTVMGYEIHMGQTRAQEGDNYLVQINLRSGQAVQDCDGIVNASGKVFGTHIHGLFDNQNLMLSFINAIRQEKELEMLGNSDLGIFRKEKNYDQLAEVVRNALDMKKLYQIMNTKGI